MNISMKTVSIKRFILRSESLRLYRDFLRLTKILPNDSQREQLRMWVRIEFENNIGIEDDTQVRLLISKGRTSFKNLEQSLKMATC